MRIVKVSARTAVELASIGSDLVAKLASNSSSVTVPETHDHATSAGQPSHQAFAFNDAEDLELLVGGLLLVAILVAWLTGRCKTTPADAEAPAKRTQQDLAVEWLGTLSVVTLGLLLLQVGLGYMSGSLTLLADMAHAAGDTVTYTASYFAEKAKRDLTRRAGDGKYAAKLDMLAGATSMLLVAGLSFDAMWEAFQALGPNNGTKLEEKNSLVGPALLSFSIISFAANGSVLLFRFRCKGSSADASAKALAASPVASPPPMSICKACPVASPSATGQKEGGRFASMSWRPASSTGDQLRLKKKPVASENGQVDWLHAMFHIGCTCADHQPNKTDADSLPENNLNLFGATLHLATDVIRSVLVLLVGLLLQVGVLTDVRKTDAVTALAVGTCVLLGTIGFFAVPRARASQT